MPDLLPLSDDRYCDADLKRVVNHRHATLVSNPEFRDVTVDSEIYMSCCTAVSANNVGVSKSQILDRDNIPRTEEEHGDQAFSSCKAI